MNYESGPFDGSQPHFHGSAIAMMSGGRAAAKVITEKRYKLTDSTY